MSKFNELIQSSTPVLVDFYAEWCAPCKTMVPILKEVKDMLNDDVRIIKINVDHNQDLASRYGIQSIPTMLLFKNGQKIWSTMGAMPANQLMAVIKQHI